MGTSITTKIYFDNAATTPLAPEVIQSMTNVMLNVYGNPSSIHHFGRQAKVLVEKARKTIAAYLNTAPSEIFFTSGGTEANNMAIYGAIYSLGVTNVITSPIEHHAVLHTLQNFEKRGNITLHLINIDSNGNLDINQLEALLKTYPKALVSLMHGNNEIANMLSIKLVSKLCRQHGAYFHCDMVQTIGHYKVDLQAIDIDLASCSAHKFHGPKGIGFLYINSTRIKISPLLYGGAQERNMRAGTENIYGIVGMAKAFDLAYQNLDIDQDYITKLKLYAIQSLSKIEGIKFLGDSKNKGLITILNILLPQQTQIEPDMFLMNLDMNGIAVSSGSACASGTNLRSHVLEALQIPQNNIAIRISFSKYNTKTEIETLTKVIAQLLEPMKINYKEI